MSDLLILQHGEDGPPGLLGEWAARSGLSVEIHPGELDAPLPDPAGVRAIASLGSNHTPDDLHIPEVAREREYLAAALHEDVPVLGLCFGAQMLSAVLGGRIERAPEPELGWCAVDPAPEAAEWAISAGPWLQWHFWRFSLPEGARALASSPVGLQAFSHRRSLGVQFHPEATVEIVAEWARADTDQLAARGITDGPGRLRADRDRLAAAHRNAFTLFDAFWRQVQTPHGRST